MAEMPIFSSQNSLYEANKITMDQENLMSSPPRTRSVTTSTQKPKKPPTVTPKRFTKFFTPRTSLSSQRARPSKAGRQLRDITQNGINRRRSGTGTADDCFGGIEKNVHPRPFKRQKLASDVESSPPQSSPLKHVHFAGDTHHLPCERLPSPTLSDMESLPDIFRDLEPFPRPVRRARKVGQSRRLLERSFGGFDATSRERRRSDHAVDARAETAGYLTTPGDTHSFTGPALPFCTASCNTNSLVAVGDEEGGIRLIDSAPDSDFKTIHVNFRVHNNALMDLAFSPDDYLLATASGDQTTRLVDMHTQRTVCVLSGHKSSVKQVRFNPREENIITTSSRDGTVQVWDLRCGGRSSIQSLRNTFQTQIDGDGHVEPETRYSTSRLDVAFGHRSITRPNIEEMRNDLSITAFQHMPNGREHLIITASEINASIKLWDIRNAGRRNPVPLASTPIPESHRRTRNFGINSMVISGDGARLYAVCRDATVYTYSTNQLALGHVPEMLAMPSRRRMLKEPKGGLAPLYGFRHPSLRVGSFYVKASLRRAKDDRGEMLAVGSTDECAVLFPTDERHFPRKAVVDIGGDEEDLPSIPTVALYQSPSIGGAGASAAAAGSLPIHELGTALVRGHTKEVTSVVWSTDGDLISVSDDFTARCWRNDSNRARELRTCGEGEGARWGSGWAAVDAAWDEEDC